MRYEHLDYDLPINAFSPRGGRGPFSLGMTLEGKGGGGGVLGSVTKAVGSVVGGVTNAVKAVVQPVYNATLKQIPGVDQALVGLDKSVGSAIPGGWGTVASVAASFIPGAQLAAMGMTPTGLATGLGALSGSGVMHKGNNFNLQGAIMGGAMAYGASQLAQGLENAGNATPTDELVKANIGTPEVPSNLVGTSSAPTSGASSLTPNANALQNAASDFSSLPNAPTPSQSFQLPEGSNFGLKNLATNPVVPSGDFGLNPAAVNPSGLGTSAAPGLLENVASGASEIAKGTGSNLADAGAGIKNLVGLGAEPGTASAAFTALKEPITNAGMASLVGGTMGLSALEEQKKYLEQQLSAGNIAQDQYNSEMAAIDAQIAVARKAVSENPLQSNADLTNVKDETTAYDKNKDSLYAKMTNDATLYDKDPTGGTKLMYAMGGPITNPPDDQTGMPNQTPMGNFEQGGLMSMIGRTAPTQMYASGGIAAPRFLSGGGDGMSDSIKANIDGSQEARLADGEFVIPADVVSHLGNGSSKAGAKQLYSMMDKVRQARTGTKKQGKQINPRKYLAA